MNLSRRRFLYGATALAVASAAAEGGQVTEESVFELRQYTLKGGTRSNFISLFEQNFVESQKDAGAHVCGIFRDLDDPDRFVWIRGFQDMTTRRDALAKFYGSPVWTANRTAANSMIVDSDNVLLLRPSGTGMGIVPTPSSGAADNAIVSATIHYLGTADSGAFTQFFEQVILPELRTAGVSPGGRLVTEESPNNFPRLPVREHDRVFIWFARWSSVGAEEAFVGRFSALSGWRDSAPEAVLPGLMRKPERLRLAPTAKSELR